MSGSGRVEGPRAGGLEAAWRASEARFRAVWEASADAMVLSDAEGVVLDANPAYLRLYGYSADEVVGQDFAVIFPAEQREWARAQYRAVFAGEGVPPAFEAEIQRRDGTRRVVESRIDFLVVDGRRTAMLSTVRDVTERAQALAERERLLAAEQAARAQAEAALRTRDTFLATISHDLQNPLAAIKGRAQLLQRRAARSDGLSVEQALETVASIEKSADQMALQINELMDVARLQAGEALQLARKPVDLVALVRAVIDAYQGQLAGRDVQVAAAEDALVGEWDPVRLRRVIANLLVNAAKYSPEGAAITVRVGRAETAAGPRAVLAVADTGLGIPAADLPRVFERFHRASNVVGVIPGTGLGLASARHVVELHGGTIELASEEGRGTTATVSLPL